MTPSALTIVRPDDWHLHLRDGSAMRSVVGATARVFGRAVVMPNLKPPVTTVAMAGEYRERIAAALPSASRFAPLMTLYLTDRTTSAEIASARASGFRSWKNGGTGTKIDNTRPGGPRCNCTPKRPTGFTKIC